MSISLATSCGAEELVEMQRCCNSLEDALLSCCSTSALQPVLGSGLCSFSHAPETSSYLRQPVNCRLTMCYEQQARNYAQYCQFPYFSDRRSNKHGKDIRLWRI